MRKVFALALSILLLAAAPVSALAAEWTAKDYTFTVPEAFVYTFTPAVPATDPSWTMAGVSDPTAMLEDYQDMGVVADFRTESGQSMKLMEKSAATAQTLFDLSTQPQETLDEFLDQLITAQQESVSVDKRWVDVNGRPFYRLQIDSVTPEGEAHELIWGTIFNGHTVTFDVFGGQRPVTPEEEQRVEAAVYSLAVTRVEEKAEAAGGGQTWLLALLLVALALVVAAPIVYLPLKRRREKREREETARRLAAFRAEHPNDSLSGAPLFVNETEVDRAAIHSFAVYHAYVKNLAGLIAGALLCLAAVAMVFLANSTWWLKLAAAAVTGYYLYRVISVPGGIERTQQRMADRAVTRRAGYYFYADGFRVSGMQSTSLSPYFELKAVRTTGHYALLYYSRENAYILDLNGFKQGDAQEFIRFIREKAGE